MSIVSAWSQSKLSTPRKKLPLQFALKNVQVFSAYFDMSIKDVDELKNTLYLPLLCKKRMY